MLKNYMEIVVDHVLPSILKVFPDTCKCQQCLDDIRAIALNHLKPHYVVTEKGEIYSRINEMNIQFETDVMKALIDAIAIVSKNPRHK
ncbi:late competence development ComFB family protein [Anaerosolibacter sp.]|uniref:late competence development ComFB family protein n=1 Tax=Anaerosolibacter sp. TaxID=1872527 RepID=UPI0039F07459